MKRLISMTEFVLDQEKLFLAMELMSQDFGIRTTNYARLLKTPLSISMFIPCHEGESLERPNMDMDGKFYMDEGAVFQWAEAEGKILFEGWKIKNFRVVDEYGNTMFFKDPKWVQNYPERKTIEDLISSEIELTLTESCRKQIGL